jgi:hypothetical protein
VAKRVILSKTIPTRPKNTGKGPESNAVGVVNSGTEAVDLETETRDKSGGAYRPLSSRGLASRLVSRSEGCIFQKTLLITSSERHGRSYSNVVANNLSRAVALRIAVFL